RYRNRGDLRIGVEVSLRQHLAEFFGAQARVLAGDDIDDILDRIRRHRGGIVGVAIGTGKIALDHRLDAELADFVALAIAVNPHDPDAALPVSVPDQRHRKASRSTLNLRGPTRYGSILSNLRATGQGLRGRASGTSLVSVQTGLRACIQGDTEHEQRNPSGRPDPADATIAGPRPAACAGDVCRRGCGPADYRPGLKAAAGRRCLPDQRR